MDTTKTHSLALLQVVVPLRLRVSLLNFLNFFSEYARVIAEIPVFVEYSGTTNHELHTLVLHLKCETSVPEQRLKELLRGYLEKIFSDTPLVLLNTLSRYETDLFLILYKRTIADIRTDLRYSFNLLSDAEKTILAEALIKLSLTEEPEEKRTLASDSIEIMVKRIDGLALPSEPQVIPQSLLSGKINQ